MDTAGSRTVQIDAAEGRAEAYLAGVDGAPGVLFFIDAIGLRPQIEEMADRIASWGYLVLAPHVFYRDGSAAELAPTEPLTEPGAREAFFAGGVMDRVAALTPDRSEPDSDAWMATLAEHAAPGPVGVVGYCMGARLALRAAGRFPDRVAACAGFHGGGLVTDAPDSPHLAIRSARAAMAFGHADQDRSMPPEAIATLGEAMASARLEHVNEVYAGAPHGYSMADTSMYDPDAAERSFTTLRTLLDGALSVG